MKYYKYTYLIFTLIAVLLASCSKGEEEVPRNIIPEGMVKLNFTNLVISADGTMTRAIKPMGKDSTIRVYMYKVPTDGSSTDDDDVITGTPFKEFTLRVVEESGSSYGKMCNVDNDGVFINYSNEEVIVPQGKYRISAISPAKKMSVNAEPGKSGVRKPSVQLRHQEMDFLSAGSKDYDIKAQQPEIGNGKEADKVYNVILPTFQHLMSRITFTLKKSEKPGAKIKNLKVDARGIEVINITPNSYNVNFFLGNPGVKDMEQANMGKGEITIKEYSEISPETYYFEAYMLPYRQNVMNDDLPAISLGPEETIVTFRFHLLVNEDQAANEPARYKAYLYSTPVKVVYERGKSYDYEVAVDVGGIFVNGWKEGGWETEI